MNPVYIRVLLYPLLGLLAFIPAAWANYGISFFDGVLYANLGVILEVGASALFSALGLGAAVFAFWGSGGRGAIHRTAIYILSPFVALLAASGAGYGVTVDGSMIAINVEVFITAIFAGSGLSLSIFERWGMK